MEIEQKETRLSGLRAWEWVRRKNEGLVDRKKFLTLSCLTGKECLWAGCFALDPAQIASQY